MSYTAEQLSEREFALREAEANDAEERYFEALPVDDGAMHRRSFRAGFERAWFTRGRAHADALEENARLRAERDTHVAVTERIKVALRIRGTGSYVEWAAYCRDALDKLERAEAELAKLRQHAEAMADELREPMALNDYRAAYPKED